MVFFAFVVIHCLGGAPGALKTQTKAGPRTAKKEVDVFQQQRCAGEKGDSEENGRKKGAFQVFKRKLFRQGSSVGVVIPSKICEVKGWRVGKEVVIGLARDKSVRVESVAVREK